jgi:nucleotide-binding universal stress UspA family protein
MYARILVPIDGSTLSERGLDEACAIAAKLGSAVRLIHVVDDASLVMNAAGLASNVGELLMSLASAGELILDAGRRRSKKHNLFVETVLRHCTAGRVADVIVQEATQWPAELIVIGTHGRRGVGRLLLGSDAEQVLRSAPVPVLLVRAGAAPS